MTVGLQVFDANGKETVNSNQTLLNVVEMGYKSGSGFVTIPAGINNPLIAICPESEIPAVSNVFYRYTYYAGDMATQFALIPYAGPNATSPLTAQAQPYSYAILSQEAISDSHGLRVVNPDGTIWNASRKLFQIDAITYRYADNWISNPEGIIDIPQSRPGKLWLILNTMAYAFTNYISGQPDIRKTMCCWRLQSGVTQVAMYNGGSGSTCDVDSGGSYLSIISGFIE